ncbi:MAG: hypothetical protein A3F11_00630 [Gammaproteobacteria bacterium RIFCSPHIGHO2_12_FULL_37_14]|nr:MAG: hypothetical protein A3F11_00630 [Gammaproteobacteria bacterium RIFCSPHIGHO2_12_FULL_37_14]
MITVPIVPFNMRTTTVYFTFAQQAIDQAFVYGAGESFQVPFAHGHAQILSFNNRLIIYINLLKMTICGDPVLVL